MTDNLDHWVDQWLTPDPIDLREAMRSAGHSLSILTRVGLLCDLADAVAAYRDVCNMDSTREDRQERFDAMFSALWEVEHAG